MKFTFRLPAFALNGISVALGLGSIQFFIGALTNPHLAQLALSGAICASIADVPNTTSRTWQRVSTAAALSFITAILVAMLRPYPVAMGAGVALIGFLSMMMMAWGPRAGAVSFAPILATVFAMAAPAAGDSLIVSAQWHAIGSIAYVAWSLAATSVLQRRYRSSVLSDALSAVAELLRTRAHLLVSPTFDAIEAGGMRIWIKGESGLAERLQTGRDFVFVQSDTEQARRETAILLRAIDLRDVLLASRLDLDVFGTDDAGRSVLQRVADVLSTIGAVLDDGAANVGSKGSRGTLPPIESDYRRLFESAPIANDDPRRRLLPSVVNRLRKLLNDAIEIHALVNGERADVPLTRSQLQHFVAPEGWPLNELRAQMSLRSAVLRHAIRTALALASAYFVAQWLPWASHSYWLVLSVAVVLRGNLEQTLVRRNARVLGTMAGCAIAVLLSGVHSTIALSVVFMMAAGTAHAFVLKRYWLTATAASVMALLQSFLLNPAAGFAVSERVADTILGALLAWGFSYVLPSWERRSLPGAIARVMKDLADYAALALTLDTGEAVKQRLARRRAYDALNNLTVTLQRTSKEPRAVRVPVAKVAALLDYGHRLMAHLSMARMTLARAKAGTSGPVEQALAETRDSLAALLSSREAGDSGAPGVRQMPPLAAPLLGPEHDLMPWLLRRLAMLEHDARKIREAADAVLLKT